MGKPIADRYARSKTFISVIYECVCVCYVGQLRVHVWDANGRENEREREGTIGSVRLKWNALVCRCCGKHALPEM